MIGSSVLFKFLFIFNMKHVKGALIVDDREIMVELPSDWRIQINANRFLVVKSFVGEDTAFNTEMILNVREVSEQTWKNWVTRVEMAQQEMKERQKKEVEDKIITQK